MRLIKNGLLRDGTGKMTLQPVEKEDMWHAYNLIAVGDLLRASTIRKVAKITATGATGSSQRVHLTITIRVTKIDFDPLASELHINGRVAEENEYLGIGTHHTLDLELNRNFSVEKNEGWDSVALDVVKESLRQDTEDMIPAVVMDEGLAHICLITEHQTVLKQKVESRVPRKGRAGNSKGLGDHDQGMNSFFKLLLETLIRHVDITQDRPLLLASPGFIAVGFQKYILDEATRTANKAVLGNKKNFVTVHSSSGHIHSLNEVLNSPTVQTKLQNTKYARETRLMDEFMTRLRKDDGRAWYGPREVEKAVEQGAVGPGGGVLLISNSLFRSQEIGVRKRWVSLVDKVKEEGGEARIFSSVHESGKRLEGLGGIAAILTYPVLDLDEGEEDVEDFNLEKEQVPET